MTPQHVSFPDTCPNLGSGSILLFPPTYVNLYRTIRYWFNLQSLATSLHRLVAYATVSMGSEGAQHVVLRRAAGLQWLCRHPGILVRPESCWVQNPLSWHDRRGSEATSEHSKNTSCERKSLHAQHQAHTRNARCITHVNPLSICHSIVAMHGMTFTLLHTVSVFGVRAC
jgi:hypothetical protein